MLIVIVIIGILAAALYPRLIGARGRANDVARKANLAQVGAALVMYQIDHGRFPDTAWSLSNISGGLIAAGLSSIPEDPDTGRPIFAGIANGATGQFSYTPITKWWMPWNSFVVMAGAETEWWSNRVYTWAAISLATKYEDIRLCKWFNSSCPVWQLDGEWNCCYDKNADQLRYIYLY